MLTTSELKAAFTEFDTDKSGQLEFSEVIALAEKLGVETTESEVSSLFQEIDTNQDNKVSFEEFVSWFRVGRTTKMGSLLKHQLVISNSLNDFSNSVEGSKSKINAEAGDEIARICNLAVKKTNGTKQLSTSATFEIRTGKKNAIPGLLKYAFPFYEASENCVYLTIKSSNARLLCKSINAFVSGMMLLLEEKNPEMVKTCFDMLQINASQVNDKVLVLIKPKNSQLFV